MDELVALLFEAAEQIRAYGNAGWTRFWTEQEFADYLESAGREIVAGNTSSLENLWTIFAPTCDWDDARGSQELANKILPLIEKYK